MDKHGRFSRAPRKLRGVFFSLEALFSSARLVFMGFIFLGPFDFFSPAISGITHVPIWDVENLTFCCNMFSLPEKINTADVGKGSFFNFSEGLLRVLTGIFETFRCRNSSWLKNFVVYIFIWYMFYHLYHTKNTPDMISAVCFTVVLEVCFVGSGRPEGLSGPWKSKVKVAGL